MIKDKFPDMSAAAQKELAELIENRLIADRIVLKEGGAEAVRLWKAEAEDLLKNLDEIYRTRRPVSDVELSRLAYIKALNPDIALIKQVDDIIGRFGAATKTVFDEQLDLMLKVMKNV